MDKTLAQCDSNSIEVVSSNYYSSFPYYLVTLISFLGHGPVLIRFWMMKVVIVIIKILVFKVTLNVSKMHMKYLGYNACPINGTYYKQVYC